MLLLPKIAFPSKTPALQFLILGSVFVSKSEGKSLFFFFLHL